MTTNQCHAVELAKALLKERVTPHDLPEREWDLLLLAAGMNCAGAKPAAVSYRVLTNAQERVGYFADL